MAYNSGTLLLPPTLKPWKNSTLRSCAWLWTPPGMSLIHSSEGTSIDQQSKKKSAVTTLNMVLDSAPIPTSRSKPSWAAWQQTPSTVSA
jgi:hypothetical protein